MSVVNVDIKPIQKQFIMNIILNAMAKEGFLIFSDKHGDFITRFFDDKLNSRDRCEYCKEWLK
jgi:hypothetical protein